jgi:hypothetical protein
MVVSCIGDEICSIEVPFDGDKGKAYLLAEAEFQKRFPNLGNCGRCGDISAQLVEPDGWYDGYDDETEPHYFDLEPELLRQEDFDESGDK